ncbi:hypothetical protein NKG05_26260 [Oerskovia sp. M15]
MRGRPRRGRRCRRGGRRAVLAHAPSRGARRVHEVEGRGHREHRRPVRRDARGGLFLQEFVGSTPWAHLDIAGPAFNEGSAFGYTPVGGTGVAVRTLVELLEARAGR